MSRKIGGLITFMVLLFFAGTGFGIVMGNHNKKLDTLRTGDAKSGYVPGEIIVKFKPAVTQKTVNALAASNRASVERKLRLKNRNVHLFKTPAGVSEAEFIKKLEKNPNVIYAERNGYVHFRGVLYPNDTYFTVQWPLNNTGQSYPWNGGCSTKNGTTDADIDAPEGWYEIYQQFGRVGDPNIVIAVVDTGVDMTHPDIANSIWTNPDEIAGNGIDDDNNGYVDDVHGWDFVNDDNSIEDVWGHGTGCAGIAAATTDNNVGIAGVAYGCTIMPVKMLTTLAGVAESIDYATNNGANIISMSFGYYGDDAQTLADSISKAYDANCVLVTAAGNWGNCHDAIPDYPSCFPQVINVSSTDSNDEIAICDYGSKIAVAAPGEEILVLTIERLGGYPCGSDPNAKYAVEAGTSAACPVVSGLAGLCLSVLPDMKPGEVKCLIRSTADDLGAPGRDNYYGEGRINVYNAVSVIMSPNSPGKAINLFPQNGSAGMNVNVDLRWALGYGTFSHDMYFGTDFNSVNNADISSAEFKGNQFDNIFDQNTLEPNTVYYWRIDERNNHGASKGDVWSFTTGPGTGILYVDANAAPNGNGYSWANAFDKLQDALEVACSGDEIWVAQGTYTAGLARDSGFQMVPGVAVYGGFNGTETSRDQRDWSSNETILSGDVNNDDNGFSNNGENVYHVVFGTENAALDGFAVTGGNASDLTGSFYKNCGGGAFNGWSSFTLKNCKFSGNSADEYGGGMYNEGGSPTVTDCAFISNSGGYYGGGGMCNYRSSPKVSNCVFNNNYAFESGGGIYNEEFASPIVKNCIFSGNQALYGGGTYCHRSLIILDNSTFSSNSAVYGGAMYQIWSSSPTVTNCILWGNTASVSGDEVYNNLIMGSCNPLFSFCDIEDSNGSGANWSSSLGIDDGNNIDAYPCFIYSDPNLHLDINSPCIDKGEPNNYGEQTDIDGQGRVKGNGVDIGADETDYVCETCLGDINGDGWIKSTDVSVLVTLLTQQGSPYIISPTDPLWKPCADFNNDGLITGDDAEALLDFIQALGPPYRKQCE